MSETILQLPESYSNEASNNSYHMRWFLLVYNLLRKCLEVKLIQYLKKISCSLLIPSFKSKSVWNRCLQDQNRDYLHLGSLHGVVGSKMCLLLQPCWAASLGWNPWCWGWMSCTGKRDIAVLTCLSGGIISKRHETPNRVYSGDLQFV